MVEAPGPRKPTGKKRYATLLLPPLMVAVALIGVLTVFRGSDSRQELDNDLCTLEADESNAQAVLLLDFRKPLEPAYRTLPGETLRDVSLGLSANTELRVFALAPDSHSPRLSIDRVCKPYNNTDLQIGTAKDQRDTLRDCDDLPAQLPASLREAAGRFCARRQSLQNRVNAMARNQSQTPVTNSYLIEALEDTVIDLSKGSGPRTIYVFSDMMQHARWYSHLDLEWTEWNFEDFDQTRAALTARMGRRPPVSNLTVQVYYIPRLDLTDQPRPKRAHQAFWNAYFDNAQLTFHEQPPSPTYAAEPLMDRLTPEEMAAQERERIEQERQEAARMLAEVRRARAELDAERQRIDEERARMTVAPRARPERAAELRRQEQSLADQTEELAARQAEIDDIETREAAEAEPPQQVAEQLTEIETSEEDTVASQQTAPESVEDNVSQQTVSESVEPEEPMSDDASEDIGQLALATDRPPATTLPPCNATLLPRFLAATDIYPGRRRMNYGSAMITVRYIVDEEGATINDEIEVVTEESSAERPRSFDLFAQTATQVVRNWVFEFEGEAVCSKRQERITRFQFQYD